MTATSPSPAATGHGVAVVFEEMHRWYGPVHALDGLSDRHRPGRARSPCSARRAAARRPRCARSAGSTRWTQGRILVDGKDMTRVPANKRNMGIVFQAYSLFPNMTARDNVAYGLRLRGVDKRDPQASRPRRRSSWSGLGAAGEPLPAPDVRRPAAARGPGAGPRHRAQGAPPRRAALRARRQGPPPAARGDPPDPDHGRDHHPVRHPRPGGGAGDGRPRRRHVAPAAWSRSPRRPSSTTGRGPRFVAEFVGLTNRVPGDADGADGAACSARAIPLLAGVGGARPSARRSSARRT